MKVIKQVILLLLILTTVSSCSIVTAITGDETEVKPKRDVKLIFGDMITSATSDIDKDWYEAMENFNPRIVEDGSEEYQQLNRLDQVRVGRELQERINKTTRDGALITMSDRSIGNGMFLYNGSGQYIYYIPEKELAIFQDTPLNTVQVNLKTGTVTNEAYLGIADILSSFAKIIEEGAATVKYQKVSNKFSKPANHFKVTLRGEEEFQHFWKETSTADEKIIKEKLKRIRKISPSLEMEVHIYFNEDSLAFVQYLKGEDGLVKMKEFNDYTAIGDWEEVTEITVDTVKQLINKIKEHIKFEEKGMNDA